MDRGGTDLALAGTHAPSKLCSSSGAVLLDGWGRCGGVAPQLWDLGAGEVLLQLFQKSFSRDAWPAIQLSPGEDLAFVTAPNAVNVYLTRDFSAGAPPTSPTSLSTA